VSEECRNDAAYVLGALSPADRQAYERHSRDCQDCQDSVQQLAGLPGLLALTSAEAIADPVPSVPPTSLPGLIARVARQWRRRRWVIGGVLAASLAVVAASVSVLVLGSATPATTTVAVESQPMTQVVPSPMTASVELASKQWGTAITVVCQYAEYIDPSVSYDLTVIDVDGHPAAAGTWRAVAGATMRVATATSVPEDRIATLEVRLSDGRTILQADR
jgi:hypothetical protein